MSRSPQPDSESSTSQPETEVQPHKLFREIDLECLGLCDSPSKITEIIGPYASKESVKLVHLSLSGKEAYQDATMHFTYCIENPVPFAFEGSFGRNERLRETTRIIQRA